MGFIESYKHLEKICGQIMKDERRLSAYIEEMTKNSKGAFYVNGWNEDLRRLKHYRWVRNQISHEPGCTEENMCEPDDAVWLDDFYARILNQCDPLALYYQAMKSHTTQPLHKGRCPHQTDKTLDKKSTEQPNENHGVGPHMAIGCVIWPLCALIFVVVLLFSGYPN